MRRIYLPLFWKFSLAIIVIVIIFGSINAYLIWQDVQWAMEQESEKRGLYIARSLASQAVDLMLYEDLVGLQKLLDSVTQIDSSVAYILVLDANGTPVVHTFSELVPSVLLTANHVKNGNSPSVALIAAKNEPWKLIRDIAVPVLEGKLGSIRLGLMEESIREDVEKTVMHFWIMAGFFLFIGLVGAFLFANFINRPIRQIQSVAAQMNLVSLKNRSLPKIKIRDKFLGKWKPLFRAEDEIDNLTRQFNHMLVRLEDAYHELQMAQAKLLQSEKMASIGTMAAGLAHEINNPLAGVQNCLNRINRNPDNHEQNARYLKMMNEAVGRIEQVVRQILNYSRKQDLNLKEVCLDEVISKSLLLVTYRLEKNQIKFEQHIPENCPRILGSAHHLEQIFVNLLMNSVDAIEERAAQIGDYEKKIEFKAEVIGNEVYCSLKDNGIGIPEEKVSKIFSPFFTTKQIGKGTGLGLAVSYNIIQAHNGRIEVKSEWGKGTRFDIWLPVYKAGKGANV